MIFVSIEKTAVVCKIFELEVALISNRLKLFTRRPRKTRQNIERQKKKKGEPKPQMCQTQTQPHLDIIPSTYPKPLFPNPTSQT